jgi:hypothetical protein
MGENHPAADLGRYTHRVAIANSRLVGLTEGRVSFRWKDYRHHDKQQREIVEARLREPRRCRKLPEAELRDACGTGARLVVGRGVETGRTRDTSAHNLMATVR